MTRYEDLLAEIRRRKRERWIAILASEPERRGAGRRPRDPDQERLLLRLDRARLARREAGELRGGPPAGAASAAGDPSADPDREP